METSKGNRVWSTGAQRDSNTTKPFIHNIRGYTRLRFGYHMTMGALKYGDGNWLLGMPKDQYLESLDRHLAMYMEGDRSEDHLSAIIFGAQGCMLEEQKEGIPADHHFKKKMGDGNFQTPVRKENETVNHTLSDMPLEFRYNYSEESITRGELSILVQEYPNDMDLGREIRKRVAKKQTKEVLDKEMD